MTENPSNSEQNAKFLVFKKVLSKGSNVYINHLWSTVLSFLRSGLYSKCIDLSSCSRILTLLELNAFTSLRSCIPYSITFYSLAYAICISSKLQSRICIFKWYLLILMTAVKTLQKSNYCCYSAVSFQKNLLFLSRHCCQKHAEERENYLAFLRAWTYTVRCNRRETE